MSTKAIEAEEVEMPHAVQIGDRVKLREHKRQDYVDACKLAGWTDFDPDKVRTVTRIENLDGERRRLFFDGPPFCFWPSDVVLAWSVPSERREMLKAAGWRV